LYTAGERPANAEKYVYIFIQINGKEEKVPIHHRKQEKTMKIKGDNGTNTINL
jgi:hypothetical protein